MIRRPPRSPLFPSTPFSRSPMKELCDPPMVCRPTWSVDSVPRYGRYRAGMTGMTIGKLAAAEGVSVETVRFYQRRGLLAKPDRRGSRYREYSDADRWPLVVIQPA